MKAIQWCGCYGSFEGIANPIIKACVVHRTGDNTRIDRRPPAHLNCAHLLQYKRQQEQILLITLPNVNSQDEQWNEHYPHFLSWRGGDDKNFLIKGRECSISFWLGKQQKERRINLKAVVLLPIPTPVSELKKREWIMGCPSAVGSSPDWDFL